MPGIKATNSSNLIVTNCTFSGFDTDIELENVDGFVSKNNQFSGQTPVELLELFKQAVSESSLTATQKQQLFTESLNLLVAGKSKRDFNAEVAAKKHVISSLIGSKAADYFVQVAAAVTAGLMLHVK